MKYLSRIFYLILCIGLLLGIQPIKRDGLKTVPEVQIKELDIKAIESREDERVFSISINDFIESYNGFYWEEQQACYLLPPDEWQYWEFERGIHSKYPTNRYQFSQNKEIWTLPTITVYTPKNS